MTDTGPEPPRCRICRRPMTEYAQAPVTDPAADCGGDCRSCVADLGDADERRNLGLDAEGDGEPEPGSGLSRPSVALEEMGFRITRPGQRAPAVTELRMPVGDPAEERRRVADHLRGVDGGAVPGVEDE